MEEPKIVETMAPPNTKKRALDITHLQNHPYYKMRATVKDLRPHFIKVLQTPDFQNCQAATEIREKVKLLMDLYKEITVEKIGELKNVGPDQKTNKEAKIIPEKKQTENGRLPGTYILGQSVVGWNFITFNGGKPVYYGVTKEAFRSLHPKGQ